MCEKDEDVTLAFWNGLTDALIALRGWCRPSYLGLLSDYYSMLNCVVCTVAVRRTHAGMANLPNSQHDYMLSVPGPTIGRPGADSLTGIAGALLWFVCWSWVGLLRNTGAG